jgi:hypothetical protein
VTARTTIEAKAWTDIRFATLARLLELADADHAIIRTARLWSWQTEHYTPEAPTYVVDVDTIESTLGVVGAAAALVRARLAEETPDGYRICGTVGRIEWLWKKKQSSILGGEATKSKHSNRSRPIGLPSGQPSGPPLASNGEQDCETGPIGLPCGQTIGRPDGRLSSLLSGEELSPERAIPPNTELAPTMPGLPEPAPPPILPGSIARAEARRRLIGAAWQLAGDAFRELGREGIDPTAPDAWSGMPSAGSEGMKRLMAVVDLLLVGDEPDADRALAVIANRIAVAKAEGRAKSPPTRRWMTPMAIWSSVAFENAATISPEQVHATTPAGQRAGPRRSAERASDEPPRRQLKTLLRP